MKMKNLVIITLLFFSKMTFSQEKIEYGVNGGINYSDIRGNDNVDNFNYDFGFIIGLTVEYSLKDNLSIITGINYERKNAINESSDFFDNNGNVLGNTEIKSKFDYLTLPVLLKLNFDNSFFINGGSYISYLLSAESETVGVNKTNQKNTLKKIDLGLSFGIGKRFNLNENNNLNIEIRNNLGIINISDVPVRNDGTIKTNSLNLIMGLTF